jgi:hypothetical protein
VLLGNRAEPVAAAEVSDGVGPESPEAQIRRIAGDHPVVRIAPDQRASADGPPRGVLIVGGFVWSPHLPSESAGTLSVDLIARGDGVRADERTRTADPFITRTPRRLWLVTVRGAQRPGQADFRRFAP